MPEKTLPTPEEHKAQIDAYVAEFPQYEMYARVLEEILKNACKASIPDALVQSRAKSLSSFAEKAIRQDADYHCHPCPGESGSVQERTVHFFLGFVRLAQQGYDQLPK
ncbi:MAG: hypothetical protein EHM23_10305 [Acidobacteria bacterium]|nr:MAG: hypothetical protein EHM23_10305 [Acidobacteriota bacterium]